MCRYESIFSANVSRLDEPSAILSRPSSATRQRRSSGFTSFGPPTGARHFGWPQGLLEIVESANDQKQIRLVENRPERGINGFADRMLHAVRGRQRPCWLAQAEPPPSCAFLGRSPD